MAWDLGCSSRGAPSNATAHPASRAPRLGSASARDAAVGLVAATMLFWDADATRVHAMPQQSTVPAIFDSPTAQTLLDDAAAQAVANPIESARLVRRLLDEYGDRLVRIGAASDELFRAASVEAERFLLAHPSVLARFRELESRAAERMLGERGAVEVAATRRLTRSGLVATIRLAEVALREGRSDAALALLARVSAHPDLAGRELLAARAIEAIAKRDQGAVDAAAAREQLAALGDAPAFEPSMRAELDRALALVDRTAVRAFEPSSRSPLTEGSPRAQPDQHWREIWSLGLDATMFRRLFAGSVGLINPRNVERALLDANWMTAAPTVVGGAIYLCEGQRIRAIDSDSRDERWSRDLALSGIDREFGGIGDLSAVVADRGDLFFFDGHAFSNARTGGGRVWSLDAADGRTRWVTTLGRIDGRDEMSGLFPVGRPILFGETVVVTARKPTQRLEQVDWLVGLDRETGDVRWAETVAGAAGTRAIGGRRHAGMCEDGAFVVISTPLGVIARANGDDGTIEWLRRFPVPLRDPRFSAEPWEVNAPVVAGDRVLALSPDEFEIVALDRATGALREARPIGPGTAWESPRYLLSARTEAGQPLVLGVGSDIVAFDPANLSQRLWKLSDTLQAAGIARPQGDNRLGIRGRVTVAGGRVLVPGTSDLLLVDLAQGVPLAQIPDERPGNAVLLDDRIVIAGDESLRVLMPPDRAEAILRARLAASPDEPASALALLDLTLATGRPLMALESARALEASMARGFGDDQLRADAIERLIEIGSRHPELGDDAHDIAAKLATTPALRVSAQLARGDFLLGAGRAPEAVAVWRALSADASLGDQLVPRIGVLRTARGEALARLARFAARDVEIAGLLERDAEAALAELRASGGSAVSFAQIAIAHPRTKAGADAAMRAVELGGREEVLFASLIDALLPPARIEVVEQLERRATDLARAIDGERGAAQVSRRIAELLVGSGVERAELTRLPGRLAEIGAEATEGIDLPGRLVRIEVPDGEGMPPDMILVVRESSIMRLSPRDLAPIWSMRVDDRDPVVVWARDRVVVWQSIPASGDSVAVLDAETGAVLNAVPRVAELWAQAKLLAPDQPDAQYLPDGANFQPGRIRPHCDGSSVVLVRGNGDIARISLLPATEGGTEPAPPRVERRALGIIFNSTLEHGTLLLAGRDGTRAEQRPTVRVLDAVTLEERARFETHSGSDVRWLHATALGEIYVGTVAGVEGWSLSPRGGARPFLVTTGSECVQTGSPVSLGAALVVRDRVDVPLRIPILDGSPTAVAIEEPLPGRSRTIRALRPVSEGLLIHADDRLVLLAHDGSVAGVDTSARERNFVFAMPSSTGVVQLDGLGARQVGEETSIMRVEFVYLLQTLSRRHGLRLEGATFEFTCPNQRADRAILADGWLLLSNVMGISAVRLPSTRP